MAIQFEELPKKKREAIIHAGLQVFGESDYRHASTDDIARLAGVSKGSLFYYFHNKKELYGYLLEYAQQTIMKELRDDDIFKETDFFQMMERSLKKKAELMNRNSYIFAFLLKAYPEASEDAKDVVYEKYDCMIDSTMTVLLKNIDTARFKDGVDVQKVWTLLYYFAEGYMRPYYSRKEFNVDALAEDFISYMNMLKQYFYKEEYL